jgi:hypothetical protein
MGCSMGHTKYFVQILKPAKKIINLIKAAILFFILPPPNSIAPRTIEYRSRILSYLFFCPEFRWPKRFDSVLPYCRRHARRLSILYCNVTAAFWLVVVYSHPAKAIEIRGPIALSIFIFFVTPYATQSDELKSAPTHSARLHRLSNTHPTAETIIRFVVASTH